MLSTLFGANFIIYTTLFGRKGTTKFADVQILSGKSFRSLKSFNGKWHKTPTIYYLETAPLALQFRS
jgi:hypothetical protein